MDSLIAKRTARLREISDFFGGQNRIYDYVPDKEGVTGNYIGYEEENEEKKE